jgi:branched-chain amino acid transport system ATP-binding protein
MADSGRVLLDGEDVTHLRPDLIVRKGMARTFQVVRVFRHLSVYENIKAAKICNLAPDENLEEKVDEVLNLVGLERKRTEKAINLPIGDLRRLDIGRALATKPRVLLLDEPFSGLSHQEVGEIIPLLLDLRTDGMAVVIVEHVLRELKRLAENVIVLNFGIKIAEGRFEEVLTQDAVKAAFLGGSHSA